MSYLSVVQIARKWGISDRSVRNYCANGRAPGAFLTGKTWNIPENATKPQCENKKAEQPKTLLDIFCFEKRQNYQVAFITGRKLILPIIPTIWREAG